MTELGSLSRFAAFSCLLLAVTVQCSPRPKRQISPAVQLQEFISNMNRLNHRDIKRSVYDKRHLSPAMDAEMAMADNQFSRLMTVGKRHLSPAMDADNDAGTLRSLMSVGKRQLSPAMDVDNDAGQLRSLMSVGKRQISPAMEAESDVGTLRSLISVGKRQISPAAELDDGTLRSLMQVGKRQLSASADIPNAQMYMNLFEAGKRGAISPAADLNHQLSLQSFFDNAGRR